MTAAGTEESAGDTFEALYRAHYPAMMRVGFLLTGPNEAAEDVVHDVFVRAQRHFPLEHPASYLRAAVVNACRDQHRRTVLVRRHEPPPAPQVMPRELVELRDVLLRLPARQRSALVLRYFCDTADVDIAQVIGCRPSTVQTLVHRGLAQLRELIG